MLEWSRRGWTEAERAGDVANSVNVSPRLSPLFNFRVILPQRCPKSQNSTSSSSSTPKPVFSSLDANLLGGDIDQDDGDGREDTDEEDTARDTDKSLPSLQRSIECVSSDLDSPDASILHASTTPEYHMGLRSLGRLQLDQASR